MSEPTNADVLDAVTLELSRFTRDVVAEVHRLRDELIAERERIDQLESTVQSLSTSLHKFDRQASGIVDHVTRRSAVVDQRLDAIENMAKGRPTPLAPVAVGASVDSVAEPPAVRSDVNSPAPHDKGICFAPLTLTLDPVEAPQAQDPSIGDLVARVVGAIEPPVEQAHDRTASLDPARSGTQ